MSRPEQHSRKAQELDPDSKAAPLFIARTIHAQYRPGVAAPENIAKAREAIEAYRQILQNDPQNEEAYRAIAFLYERIKEDGKLREWIMSRANDSAADPEKRAEAYIVLASKDWNCSFQITDLPSNKVTTVSEGKATVSYKKPNQKDFETAQMCVKRGLEEVENAIKFDPNNEPAWSYKTNLSLRLLSSRRWTASSIRRPNWTSSASRAEAYRSAERGTTKNTGGREAKKAASPPSS